MASKFEIEFTRTAYRHLAAFRKFDRNRILDQVKAQLAHQPNQETHNRKRLRSNPISDWELRVDPFRVLYEVDEGSSLVTVVGVGVKKREKLVIDGEEIVI